MRKVNPLTLDRFGKTLLFILVSLPSLVFAQSESGIFEMNGKRIYYLVDNGKKHFVDENGKKIRPVDPDSRQNRVYHEKDLITSSGKTYYFDYGWDQIISNDKVVIEYNFNKRRYEWVEHQNVDPKRRTESKDAARIYTKNEGYKTPEHGDITLLTYRKGTYYDEFGNPQYTLKGSFPGWCSIVMFHDYYEKHYTGSRLDSLLAIRKPYRDSLNNAFSAQNTMVTDMIELGNKYKKTVVLTNTYRVVYFSIIDGQPKVVNEEQIKDIRNDWFIINENTRRRTNPFEMPEAGHYTKKKDAKKLGLPLPSGTLIIWEVKIKPEYQDDFSSLIKD